MNSSFLTIFRSTFVMSALFLISQAHADAPVPEKQKFHLNEKSENEIGYAQAVRVGDVLYISGSVGAGPMPKAIQDAYEELRKTLAAYGLTFRNVVKENVYTTRLMNSSSIRTYAVPTMRTISRRLLGCKLLDCRCPS